MCAVIESGSKVKEKELGASLRHDVLLIMGHFDFLDLSSGSPFEGPFKRTKPKVVFYSNTTLSLSSEVSRSRFFLSKQNGFRSLLHIFFEYISTAMLDFYLQYFLPACS